MAAPPQRWQLGLVVLACSCLAVASAGMSRGLCSPRLYTASATKHAPMPNAAIYRCSHRGAPLLELGLLSAIGQNFGFRQIFFSQLCARGQFTARSQQQTALARFATPHTCIYIQDACFLFLTAMNFFLSVSFIFSFVPQTPPRPSLSPKKILQKLWILQVPVC